jgi:hypothetical protein
VATVNGVDRRDDHDTQREMSDGDMGVQGHNPKVGYATLTAGPEAVNVTANPEAHGVDVDLVLAGQECASYSSQRARSQGGGRTADEHCTALQAAYPGGVNLTAGGICTEEAEHR